MPASDQDIWNAATLYVKQHGDDAHHLAQQRAAELLAADDREGYAIWVLVTDAIEELLRQERRSDEPTH